MSEASELVARESSSKIPAATSSPTPSSGEAPRSGTKKVGSSKFELIAELGRGGMATVYLARAKRRPEKLLVLKQLRADLADNPEFLAMFLEEARLAGKLQHPNIVETYEVGEDAGTYYIAMEYLDGLSLQAVLAKFGWKGNFTFAMQVYVLIEVLKGLEHAYNQLDDEGNPLRIVHRDVSPPNIIITFDGQVKLVDFGIAKAANSNVETRTGLIKGKLTYMAPEQAQSGDVDARTDIYSVGVMLWQAAAGQRRWKGIENTEVLKRLHSGDVTESPNAKQNNLPGIVDEIVMKATATDPDDRDQSANALRASLESLLRSMNANVGARELSVFMNDHFGEARARATEVMSARIEMLNGKPEKRTVRIDGDKVSTPVAVSTPQHKQPGVGEIADRNKRSNHRNGGPAAGSVAKQSRTDVSASTSLRTAEDSAIRPTAAWAGARRKSITIAFLGIALATILAVLASHARREEKAQQQSAKATIAAAAPPPTITPLPQSGQEHAVPVTATASATPGTQNPVTLQLPSNASGRYRASAANNVAPATQTVIPVTVAPAPSGIPSTSIALSPSASSLPPSSDPALDKQDPWKANGVHLNNTDPWDGVKRPTPHPDPWAQ